MAVDRRQHHALRLVCGEGAKGLGSPGVAVVGREGEPIPPDQVVLVHLVTLEHLQQRGKLGGGQIGRALRTESRGEDGVQLNPVNASAGRQLSHPRVLRHLMAAHWLGRTQKADAHARTASQPCIETNHVPAWVHASERLGLPPRRSGKRRGCIGLAPIGGCKRNACLCTSVAGRRRRHRRR